MHKIVSFFAFFFLFLTALSRVTAQASPDTLPEHNPQICVGYRGSRNLQDWSKLESWGFGLGQQCPPDHALFDGNQTIMLAFLKTNGTTQGFGATESGEERLTQASCCPLPATDILTNETLLSYGSCPPDYVVTGQVFDINCTHCKKPFYCTKINTTRYQLAPKRNAIYWGFGSAFWLNSVCLMKKDIPAAIRYSIGRLGRFRWELQGCLGYPFGSLLVETKKGIGCSKYQYRQLQFRGLPGDPPRSTPVKMFPDCDQISDYFVPHPECIKFSAEEDTKE